MKTITLISYLRYVVDSPFFCLSILASVIEVNHAFHWICIPFLWFLYDSTTWAVELNPFQFYVFRLWRGRGPP